MATIYLDGRAPEKLNPKDFIPKLPTQPILLKTTPPSTAIDAYTKRLQRQIYTPPTTASIVQPDMPKTSYLENQTPTIKQYVPISPKKITAPQMPTPQMPISKSPSSPSIINQIKAIGQSARGGLTGVNANYSGTVKAADELAAEHIFKGQTNNFLKPIYDYYLNENQRQQQVVQEEIEKGNLNPLVNDFIQSAVGVIPNAVLGLMTGGTSLGAQSIASLAAPTTLTAATTATKQLAKNPQFWASMTRSFGGAFNEAVAAGADNDTAIRAAVMQAVPQSMIEVSGGTEKFIERLASKTKGLKGSFLKSALEEGLEEIVQYPFEGLAKKATYEPNMPVFSTKQQAIINPIEQAKAGAMGVGIGAFAGGTATFASNASNAIMERMANKPQTQIQPLAKQQELTQNVLSNKLSQQLQQQVTKQDVLLTQPTTQIQQDTTTLPIDTIVNAKQTLPPIQPIKPVQPPQRTPQGKAFLPPTIKNQRIMAQNFPNSAETISSGIKHNASEADINRISELSERMGVKIVFENNKTGNGRYQNDTIYINKNSQTPIKDTFIHELTHYIEKSGKYNDFANAVMDSDVFLREIHDSGLTVAEYKQRIKDDYLQNGVVLGDDGVNHEIVAKFAESYLSDEQTINRLAKTNATVFEKIKQWVDDMLQRFRGTNEERSLLKMRRLYDKALKSVGEAKGAGAEFSVVTKPDGEYRVVVDRNIFKGKTVAERPATLKKYIMENIRGEEFKSLVDGETIKTPQSNNDIGKLSRPGLKMADEKYAARLNTAAHLDEVIQASSLANSVADEGGKHKEKAAEGIDYRTFEIEIPQLDESDNIVDASVWRGQLTVLKSENGELAYDISRLKDISKDTYSVLYRLKKSEAEIDKVSYNKIISNISKKVNSQYSVEKGTVQQATERAEQPTPINKKPMQEKPEDVEEVVRVLIKTPREALPKTERLKEMTRLVKRKLVDSGEAIGRISRIAKDPTLYYAYNNAKQAKQTAESMLMEQQSDIHGNKIGKSLIEIFEPIQKQGDKAYQDFSEYMLHMHNVDRMEHGKPIFGDNETEYTSRQKAEALLAANPEFAITANDVYIYNRNLMQYRVDSGLVSREQADLMNIMYPHYVPTFRDVTRSGRSKAQRTKVKINQSVSTATGGESDILPLHANMARQTMQTIKMAKANVLGLRLYNNALNLRGVLGEYVGEITPQGETFDIDKGEGNVFKMRNEFVVYDNGKPITMKVNSDVFEGLEAIAGAGIESNNFIVQGARKANNAFKELVTGKNPMFMLKNPIRDIQEVGLYTENLADFIKTYPKAFAEITSNSSLFRKYKALGGFGSSVFDYDQGYDPSKIYNKNGVAKAFDKIEEGNFLVEQLPRFTEFMAQIKRGGEGYDNLMRAMYMAADVTVNFGRSGTWGKTLNSTFVPFFNPAMQGFDKLIRTYTQAKGAKEWTTLVLRTVSLAIAPALLNEFVNGDDEEYELISDREKDLNYLFKIKDGLWAKIPKGRVVSVFGGAAQRALRQTRGEENAWAGFISTAVSQVAPTNPFTNHILMQGINIDLRNADSPGKTWYGTDIEPQRLRGFRPGLRFDEKTDYFSKWVGNVLNVSPKKINYLLDSYTGVIGDFALPLLTPQAERNPFSKAFTIDPVMQNKLSQQFYEKLTQLEQAKNDINEPDKYNLMYRYMNKQAQALTEFNKEIRKIEMSNISNADKKQEVREIKVVINGIQQNALMGLKEYNKAVVITGDAEKDYINANRKAFGAEYALETYDKKVYEKAVKTGVSYDAFLDAYFAQKDVKGNGEPLVASKNKMAAIDAATPHISKEERKKLYKAFDVSEKVWEETLSAPAEKVSSISTGKYEEYNKEIAKFKAEYYPNSKNEITASRKQKVYDYIKTLPLTKEQKEELYLSYYKDYGRLVVDGVKLPNGYKPLKK